MQTLGVIGAAGTMGHGTATAEAFATGQRAERDNARKDLRHDTRLTESLNVPSIVGEAVHPSLGTTSALGHGGTYVPPLVEAQGELTGAKIVAR